ncbi:hypothetical protein CU098_000140, partial [Rhizopus stolonifer]
KIDVPNNDTFISYFENCYFRAAMYLVFAVVMFLSNLLNVGPLIATGVSLLLAAICYGIGAATGQAFASSRLFGGSGVDNVKLSLLRSEAESARTTGDEYAAKIKTLEDENIQKEHEITSVLVKIKRLEEKLKKAQDESSVVDTKSSDSVHREEQAEQNVVQLEQRLEEAEKKYEELKEKNQTIKEAMEEFVRQLDVA